MLGFLASQANHFQVLHFPSTKTSYIILRFKLDAHAWGGGLNAPFKISEPYDNSFLEKSNNIAIKVTWPAAQQQQQHFWAENKPDYVLS